LTETTLTGQNGLTAAKIAMGNKLGIDFALIQPLKDWGRIVVEMQKKSSLAAVHARKVIGHFE